MLTASGFQPKFTITNAITAALTHIERARGFLEAATLSEDWIRRMGERALVLEAHHTTHIEGTRLTLEQSERLWAGEDVPEADPDDARELLNYRRAFDFVSEYLDSGAPVTEGTIRKIHKHLVEAVRGRFKKAWQERDYTTIIAVARKIPEKILQKDPKLLMWCDQAVTRMGEDT